MRKTIAVCVSGYNLESDYKIMDTIHRLCKRDNVNLLIFTSLLPRYDVKTSIHQGDNIFKGESEIFNLINYELIDGMIIFGQTIIGEIVFEKIVNSCKKHNIPFVNVSDNFHKTDHQVFIKNEGPMEQVIEHLVTDHGFTKINFIGGIPDNKESEDRLAAYRKVLERHGLPYEDSRVGYGYFWKQAEERVEEFLQTGELPQAIVCANDTMAIFAMDYLKNNGYRIPEDVVVTGFDGSSDADSYSPAITTVRPDFVKAGEETYDLLFNLINGNKTEAKDIYVDSSLCVQESCGCKKIGSAKNRIVYNYLEDTYGEHNDLLRFGSDLSAMNALFVKAQNSYSLFSGALKGVNVFNFKRLYICINQDLENGHDTFYSENSVKHDYGLGKNLVSMVHLGQQVSQGTVFAKEKLLPDNFLEENDPVCMTFTPMYFKDKYLGYTAFERESLRFRGDLFLVWLQITSNNIGSFYVRNELETMYIRDPLTGIYNRRGMKKYFEKTFIEMNERKSGYMTLLCSDIDYLKAINDQFGHEAGDNAIVRVADALKMCMPKKTICVRTGGDEYCALYYSPEKPDMERIIEAINNYLETYNERSNLPYLIKCSCGYITFAAKQNPVLDKMKRLADEALYRVKGNREGTDYNSVIKY